MKAKAFLYVSIFIIVIYSMDGLNINRIFKQGRVLQARLFYMMIALSLTYLVTNFIWDFSLASKIF